MADTIAAVATGGGVSAIGVIRISGDDALDVIARVFRPKSGKDIREYESGRLVYGEFIGAEGAALDLCLCTISRAPYSYTGENTAELHCHGSPVVLAEGLRALFQAGARQALAGEFTKRAFLNGKMDLSQASAVIDLIDAQTEIAARNALGQLKGAVGRKIEEIYTSLLDIRSHYFAVIDYPDEDIEPFALSQYKETLENVSKQLRRLHESYDTGRVLKDGVVTAIIGRPNVGKSSLLNALAGYDRAIVSPHAGTTRDTIEERVRLGSVVLRLVDTAGLRETGDEIERLGVARSKAAAEAASLVLAVFDGSEPLSEHDRAVMEAAQSARRSIAVVNKCDLPQRIETAEIEKAFGTPVFISARTEQGMEALKKAVEELYGMGQLQPDGEVLTNALQADAVLRALTAAEQARRALDAGYTPDAVLADLEEAMAALGEITGRTVKEDTISRIFKRFCVGK